MEAAVAELKAQQDAYDSKTEQLRAKSEGGGVAALRAKNELAQHLGEGEHTETYSFRNTHTHSLTHIRARAHG